MKAGSILLSLAGAVVFAGCVWLAVDGIQRFWEDA